MGEIADMMLEGILDEETGEYIGDINEEFFGDASPGFPVSYERNWRERGSTFDFGWDDKPAKVACPKCGKKVKEVGLSDHMRDKHGE